MTAHPPEDNVTEGPLRRRNSSDMMALKRASPAVQGIHNIFFGDDDSDDDDALTSRSSIARHVLKGPNSFNPPPPPVSSSNRAFIQHDETEYEVVCFICLAVENVV
jgi:hypothetical protein